MKLLIAGSKLNQDVTKAMASSEHMYGTRGGGTQEKARLKLGV